MILGHRAVIALGTVLAWGWMTANGQENVVDVQKNVVNVKDKSSKINSTVKLGPKKNQVLKGNGQIVTDTRELPAVSSISVSGAYELEWCPSADENKTVINISADANLLDNLKTRVENNQLRIYAEKAFTTANRIVIKVKTPKLHGIYSEGASNIKATSLRADILTVQCSGATTVNVAGDSLLLRVELEGAGELNALKLNTEKADMLLGGAAKAKIRVMDRLTVKASGAAEVFYLGRPTRIVKNLSGAAEIKPLTSEEE